MDETDRMENSNEIQVGGSKFRSFTEWRMISLMSRSDQMFPWNVQGVLGDPHEQKHLCGIV
jgi:hypothetical protein